MGEAKRRGTEQDRIEQAIAEGRVKRRKPSKSQMEREVLDVLFNFNGLNPMVTLPYFIHYPTRLR